MNQQKREWIISENGTPKSVSTKDVNDLIRFDQTHYTYYKEPDGIPLRIILARTKKKIKQVYVLNSGKWKNVVENGVIYQN